MLQYVDFLLLRTRRSHAQEPPQVKLKSILYSSTRLMAEAMEGNGAGGGIAVPGSGVVIEY
jgi:hypothetical protein